MTNAEIDVTEAKLSPAEKLVGAYPSTLEHGAGMWLYEVVTETGKFLGAIPNLPHYFVRNKVETLLSPYFFGAAQWQSW